MQLNPEQRKMLRRVVELSTAVSDARSATYERRKAKMLALIALKEDIRKSERAVEQAPTVGYGMIGVHRENYVAAQEEKLRGFRELATELERDIAELDRALAVIENDVRDARGVADNLLKHTGLNSDMLPAWYLV